MPHRLKITPSKRIDAGIIAEDDRQGNEENGWWLGACFFVVLENWSAGKGHGTPQLLQHGLTGHVASVNHQTVMLPIDGVQSIDKNIFKF